MSPGPADVGRARHPAALEGGGLRRLLTVTMSLVVLFDGNFGFDDAAESRKKRGMAVVMALVAGVMMMMMTMTMTRRR